MDLTKELCLQTGVLPVQGSGRWKKEKDRRGRVRKKKGLDLYIKSHKGPGLALDSARLGRL